MTTETSTEATATATPDKRTELEAAVAEATREVQTILEANNAALPALAAAQDWDKITEAGAKHKAAEARRAKALDALQTYIVSDAWEQNADLRTPVLDMLRTALIDNRPVISATEAHGRIKIVKADDGTFSFEGGLSVRFAKYDDVALSTAVFGGLDLATLFEHGMTGIEVDVSDIGGVNTIKLSPATGVVAKATSAAAAGTTDRAGGLEYEYAGEWLGTRALLERVQVEKPELVTRWSGRFAAFNAPGSNGMSNLGKDVAKALRLTSRDKAPAA